MNGGKINVIELNANISLITRYVNKEQELFQKLINSIEKIGNTYNSSNSYKITSNNGILKYHCNVLMDNRKKYISVLKNVIIKYQMTAKKVTLMLKEKNQ